MTGKSEPLEKFYRTSEVAEQVGCSERTIRREIKRGVLKACRIGPGGRSPRIRESEIKRYLAEREQ